ncbi:MAG TPA: hypothetical protein VEN82_07235 [Actinomycetota bacterium]|nr:hypothetical protein [Actinomycetota bacterium]
MGRAERRRTERAAGRRRAGGKRGRRRAAPPVDPTPTLRARGFVLARPRIVLSGEKGGE